MRRILDELLAKATEVLALHIEELLEAHKKIAVPTPASAIDRSDALLLAAVHVPDDVGMTKIELSLPALSLVRIDSIARRLGLSLSSMFIQAVNRWETEMTAPRDGRIPDPDSPTLFEFVTPLELKVEVPATAYPPLAGVTSKNAVREGLAHVSSSDLEAELEQLIGGSPLPKSDDAFIPQPVSGVKDK